MANTTKNRGHWTPGKSKNNPDTPRGWESVEALIKAVNAHIDNHNSDGVPGAPSIHSKHSLAEELGLPRSSLRGYLSGRSMPTTEIAAALAAWLRARKRKGAK